MRHADWLMPAWPWPGIGALMTTRAGGVSGAPFDALKLGTVVGDEPQSVAENRRIVAEAAGAMPVYLKQVHGRRVMRLTSVDAQPGAPLREADASVTSEPGIACAVQAADCLPVLFAAPGGRAVGAAHAGWRGLAGGVLESTLQAVCEIGGCAPREVVAWLGACIGPTQFEVGADVLQAFGVGTDPAAVSARGEARESPRFSPRVQEGKRLEDKWLADLAGLARDRLHAAGVSEVEGGGWCTVSDPSRFFSYRRDRVTGRHAALIWIERR